MIDKATQSESNSATLVIAAHGWRGDGLPDPQLSLLAENLAQRTCFEQVVSAYHRGSPSFSEVLDHVQEKTVVVVPFMTSGGYFCTEVLPRELAKNRSFGQMSVRQTAPVGMDKRLIDLVACRVEDLLHTFDLPADNTSFVIVGHGTSRHKSSRHATTSLAGNLAARYPLLDVDPAFLDDNPSIESVVDRAVGSNIVIIPFLMAGGHHALCDVPARAGLDTLSIDRLPYRAHVNGKSVLFDSPVGTYLGVAEIIAAMAEEAR